MGSKLRIVRRPSWELYSHSPAIPSKQAASPFQKLLSSSRYEDFCFQIGLRTNGLKDRVEGIDNVYIHQISECLPRSPGMPHATMLFYKIQWMTYVFSRIWWDPMISLDPSKIPAYRLVLVPDPAAPGSYLLKYINPAIIALRPV